MSQFNLNSVVSELDQRSVGLAGGTQNDRGLVIDGVEKTWQQNPKRQVFRFPENLKSHDRYLKAARNVFPLSSPLGVAINEMSLDQLWDVHLAWAEDLAKPTLIILPEFHSMLKADPSGAWSILESYVGQLVQNRKQRHPLRLLLSTSLRPNEPAESLEAFSNSWVKEIRWFELSSLS